MATPAEMTEAHIVSALRSLWAEVDGIPEAAQEWSNFTEADRSFYWFEWPDLLDGYEDLTRAYQSSSLTADQQDRYERLVHRYEEVLPIIEQLGLQTIPVPKLHSRR